MKDISQWHKESFARLHQIAIEGDDQPTVESALP